MLLGGVGISLVGSSNPAPMYPVWRDICRALAASGLAGIKLILMVSAERRTYIIFAQLAFEQKTLLRIVTTSS
jgi:hypothetical protein